MNSDRIIMIIIGILVVLFFSFRWHICDGYSQNFEWHEGIGANSKRLEEFHYQCDEKFFSFLKTKVFR